MTLLKVLFADDEIPDKKALEKKLGKKIPDEKDLKEEEVKEAFKISEYSLWKQKKTLDDISKLTVVNKYEDAIELAKDKEKQFDVAIIDLHWNDYKEKGDAGFEICEALEKTSQPFKIVYSTLLSKNPQLRRKVIGLNALPLHKRYNIKEEQIEKDCEQLKSVVIFMEMLRSQKSKAIHESFSVNLAVYGDVSGQIALGKEITQTKTLSISDKKELLDSLVEFQKEIAKLDLPEDDLSIVNGDVNAAIKEAKKEKPDSSKIMTRFKGALDTIKDVGDTFEKVSKWEWTGKIIATLGKLGLTILL
uniref:Uncharacterized protein n=1 Tax=Candidatus Methanogaster sp. ANME-2c ERB4 TaxID=2759911 RepID=A0A7G9YNE1_9EURY|nr:hypothetical protein FBKNMHLG_00044 [Methanosarcinales archaeon ANME-2c ERB4]